MSSALLEKKPKTMALYGFAANPPHRGHWDCVRQLLARVDHVLVAPSGAHAFGKQMAPGARRLDWAQKGAKDFLTPEELDRVTIWDGELRLAKTKSVVYSIDALELALAERGLRAVLALGPDNAKRETFERFKDWKRIEKDFGVIEVRERELIRSTQIRKWIRAGDGDSVRLAVGPAAASDVMAWFNANNDEPILP